MTRTALTMSETRGEVGIVRFTTSQVLDELNVQQLGQELSELVERGPVRRMVINFEPIRQLSSAVLGKLISLHKRLEKEKGRLALCCIHKNVMEVFRITRLYEKIPIFDDEDRAVRAIESPGLFVAGAR
jgi:anti-sigma B factor antagonist